MSVQIASLRRTWALRHRLSPREIIGSSLAFIALVIMLVVCFALQPSALSISGLALLLAPSVPLALAAISQMFVMSVGDIDLGNGYFVGFVTAIVAVFLVSNPVLGIALLLGAGLLYAAQAALVQVRSIPAIIVTLGASFVWLGLGLLILPIPGGTVPDWLSTLSHMQAVETRDFYILPIPMPVLVLLAMALFAWFLSIRLPAGSVMRGLGSNPDALVRAGWSPLKARLTAYGCAALFAILSGISLAGLTSSGDPASSGNYTLMSIAAATLGGETFTGGRAVPLGAVTGAVAISLVTSTLSLLNVPSSYQTGAQGIILILVLAGRALTERRAA